MAARKRASKETWAERLERESTTEIGSMVAPSLLESQVLAYWLKPNTGSRYCVLFADGSKDECSQTQLKVLLGEHLAELEAGYVPVDER